MQLSKVIAASVLFPLVQTRQLLNAISLPIALGVVVIGLGMSLSGTSGNLVMGILIVLLQYYSFAMLWFNCSYLVTKAETPRFLDHQRQYLRCAALLALYTSLLLVGQIMITPLFADFTDSAADWSGMLVQLLLAPFSLIVVHYVFSGQIQVKAVLQQSRPFLLKLYLLSLGMVGLERGVTWLLSDITSVPLSVVASTLCTYFLQVLALLLTSFFYLGMFSRRQ